MNQHNNKISQVQQQNLSVIFLQIGGHFCLQSRHRHGPSAPVYQPQGMSMCWSQIGGSLPFFVPAYQFIHLKFGLAVQEKSPAK